MNIPLLDKSLDLQHRSFCFTRSFLNSLDYCDDFIYQSDDYYTYNHYLYQLNKKNYDC